MKKIAALVVLAVLLGGCSGDVDEPVRSAAPSVLHPQVEIQVSRETNLNYPGEVWLVFKFPCEPANFGFLPLAHNDPDFDRLRPQLAEALRVIYMMDGVDLVTAGSVDVGVRPDSGADEQKIEQQALAVFRQHDFCNSYTI